MLAVDAAAEKPEKNKRKALKRNFPKGGCLISMSSAPDGLKLSAMCREMLNLRAARRGMCAQQNAFGGGAPKSDGGASEKAAAQHYSELAAQALIREVHTTPKPGLVDETTAAQNDDMDAALFELSTEAVQPFFAQMAKIALDAVCTAASGFSGDFSGGAAFGGSILPKGAVSSLKQTGILAEKQCSRQPAG